MLGKRGDEKGADHAHSRRRGERGDESEGRPRRADAEARDAGRLLVHRLGRKRAPQPGEDDEREETAARDPGDVVPGHRQNVAEQRPHQIDAQRVVGQLPAKAGKGEEDGDQRVTAATPSVGSMPMSHPNVTPRNEEWDSVSPK